jgi:large subunit ribosomal protein L21
MYAVIRSGGKQYRVVPGETVRVERLPGKVGGKVTFDDVLIVSTDDNKVLTGKAAADAKVSGKIISHGRDKKITVLKYKKNRQYKIQRGHRQNHTAVQVSDITVSAGQ